MSITKEYNEWLSEEVEYFNNEFDSYINAFYDNTGWVAYREIAYDLLNVNNIRYTVLDIGSGPQPSIPMLYHIADKYVCIDPAEKNIENLKNHFPHSEPKLGTIEGLDSYKLGTFDIVVCFGVLHHVFSPEDALMMIKSSLNENGLFISHEPSNYWDGKMGSPNERGFSYTNWVQLINKNFSEIVINRYNNTVFRRTVYTILSALHLWPIIKSVKFWKTIHHIEPFIGRLGLKGSDFLTLARV